jgi:hypothetical protein
MKTLRLVIDRPETLVIPLVRWMEGHPVGTMAVLSFLVAIAAFLDLAA